MNHQKANHGYLPSLKHQAVVVVLAQGLHMLDPLLGPPSTAAEFLPFDATKSTVAQNEIAIQDPVGWSDKILMQAFLARLKTHKPDPHIKLNEKRSNFFSFFQAFILTCGQITKIVQCRVFLGKFIQTPGISFMDYIRPFDSVCWQWHRPLRPILRKEFFKTSVRQKAPNERHHKQSQIRPPSPHALPTSQHHADNRTPEARKPPGEPNQGF